MKCILLALLAAAPALGRAQAPADSLANGKAVELTEVTVKARRVVKTADGLKLFPTPEQIEAAADGYDLLKRLALPHVRIDEVMHTIEANELIGAVQVRIDGIVAAEHELMSLEMAAVEHRRDRTPRDALWRRRGDGGQYPHQYGRWRDGWRAALCSSLPPPYIIEAPPTSS